MSTDHKLIVAVLLLAALALAVFSVTDEAPRTLDDRRMKHDMRELERSQVVELTAPAGVRCFALVGAAYRADEVGYPFSCVREEPPK
jgi:hypothetical protein